MSYGDFHASFLRDTHHEGPQPAMLKVTSSAMTFPCTSRAACLPSVVGRVMVFGSLLVGFAGAHGQRNAAPLPEAPSAFDEQL